MRLRPAAPCPREDFRHQTARRVRCRSLYDGGGGLVDHQRLVREPVAILCVEVAREFAACWAWRRDLVRVRRNSRAAANHMRPKRHIGTADIAPQDIEPLVPIVEFRVVVAFEAGSTQPKYLQVIPESGLYDGRRDVSGLRNSLGRRELPVQRRCSMEFEHDQPPNREGNTLTPGTSSRRRPRRPGRSSINGL